jgi:hypothetical protein
MPDLQLLPQASPPRRRRYVDTLAVMERRGSITAGMFAAAEHFRARFVVAQLDPLRASNPGRMGRPRERGSADFLYSRDPGPAIERARREVWNAVLAIGGLGSPGGSCLWHVVDWEKSLKEWALEQGWSGNRVSQEAASGIASVRNGPPNAARP